MSKLCQILFDINLTVPSLGKTITRWSKFGQMAKYYLLKICVQTACLICVKSDLTYLQSQNMLLATSHSDTIYRKFMDYTPVCDEANDVT